MPTYVYHCDECDTDFEVFQRFSDDPIRQCVHGHESVRRVFTPAGIIFKGSGWYIKDSKSSSGNGQAAKSSKVTSVSDSKSDVKSESSSESKSDSKSDSKVEAV